MITPTYAVLAGAVGLYLGGLAIVGGGIWVPMVTHAAYDFIALAIWVRSTAPMPPSHSQGDEGQSHGSPGSTP
jgi:membrane protease YdiL (CAAX protease family)